HALQERWNKLETGQGRVQRHPEEEIRSLDAGLTKKALQVGEWRGQKARSTRLHRRFERIRKVVHDLLPPSHQLPRNWDSRVDMSVFWKGKDQDLCHVSTPFLCVVLRAESKTSAIVICTLLAAHRV